MSAIMAQGGAEVYLHSFVPSIKLELSDQLCSPAILAQGTPRNPLNRSQLSGFQSCSGQFQRGEKYLAPARNETRFLSSPVHSLVTIITELCWLITTSITHMLLFADSWHDSIVIIFLDGYHHGK